MNIKSFTCNDVFIILCGIWGTKLSIHLTNCMMHLSHISQCTIQNRNVHISVLNGAMWDQSHYNLTEQLCIKCLYDKCIQNISVFYSFIYSFIWTNAYLIGVFLPWDILLHEIESMVGELHNGFLSIYEILFHYLALSCLFMRKKLSELFSVWMALHVMRL